MANVTHKGNPIHTSGNLPAVGSSAPDFRLVKNDLSEVKLSDFAGKTKILNIVPSLDTGTCATSTRKFEAEAAALKDTVILTISHDLPFAQSRFCKAEGISNVIALSAIRDKSFGKNYGLEIMDGLLEGLMSRSVIVVDAKGKVVYTEQVPEIAQEPDYAKALAAAKGA